MDSSQRVVGIIALAVLTLACVVGAVLKPDLASQLVPLAGVGVGAIAGVVVPKSG